MKNDLKLGKIYFPKHIDIVGCKGFFGKKNHPVYVKMPNGFRAFSLLSLPPTLLRMTGEGKREREIKRVRSNERVVERWDRKYTKIYIYTCICICFINRIFSLRTLFFFRIH